MKLLILAFLITFSNPVDTPKTMTYSPEFVIENYSESSEADFVVVDYEFGEREGRVVRQEKAAKFFSFVRIYEYDLNKTHTLTYSKFNSQALKDVATFIVNNIDPEKQAISAIEVRERLDGQYEFTVRYGALIQVR